jgi:hypothetical protein
MDEITRSQRSPKTDPMIGVIYQGARRFVPGSVSYLAISAGAAAGEPGDRFTAAPSPARDPALRKARASCAHHIAQADGRTEVATISPH